MENEFMKNRTNLINRIDNNSVIILDSGKPAHKTTDQFHQYTPHRNFYYLTGLSEPNVKLMILKDDKKSVTYLFIEETTEYKKLLVKLLESRHLKFYI